MFREAQPYPAAATGQVPGGGEQAQPQPFGFPGAGCPVEGSGGAARRRDAGQRMFIIFATLGVPWASMANNM
jgi:hypothetical protein